VFPAPSISFERRTARAGGEQRRSLPASRARRHDLAIRIDVAALPSAISANGANGLPVELPESAFRSADGEQVRFVEFPPEEEAISDGRLESGADASAALRRRDAGKDVGRSKLALLASVALHLAIAAALLTWIHEDGARIAGGTPNEIAGVGNASTDQVAAGEAVNVTITTIPVVKARPVEPSRETAKAAQSVAEPAPAERVHETPEILAAPTLSENAEAAPAARMPVETASEPAMKPAEAAAAEAPAEILPAEDAPRLAESAPVPTPRPKETAKPAGKPEKQATKSTKKPARTTARRSAPGSGGGDSADAKRGVSEGRRDGRSASSDDNARQASAAGNAAVSNYPGKVVSKLRHALRYPPEARGRRLNGVAQVQFVVGSSGDVGSVRLAGSSGSPILDEAALATVRRAAPFPPIPEGAGRSSWTFTVPLAFVR
jgi:protein TonB